MDDIGDNENHILSFDRVCTDNGLVPVPAYVDQTNYNFCFELHSGMHGDPVIYVNKLDKSLRPAPSIYLSNPPDWQRGNDEFSNKIANAALATVLDNILPLNALWAAYNT